MTINYLGVVHSVKAVLPSMLQQHSGHISFVSSSMGLIGALYYVLPSSSPVFLQSPVVAGVGFAGYTAYAPTKWAVRGLADTLRNEVRHRRILHTDAKAVLWCLGPTAMCCISFNAPSSFLSLRGSQTGSSRRLP